MSKKNLTNTVLCWDVESDRIGLVPWPDQKNLSGAFERTAGACCTAVRHRSTSGGTK